MNKNVWRKKSTAPAIGKMIEVRGSDWSEFRAKGKMELIVKNKNKYPRFHIQRTDKSFQVDRDTWSNVTEWRYLETP